MGEELLTTRLEVRVLFGEPTIQGQAIPGLFVIMIYVYILQSENSGRYYCGQTGDIT